MSTRGETIISQFSLTASKIWWQKTSPEVLKTNFLFGNILVDAVYAARNVYIVCAANIVQAHTNYTQNEKEGK